MTATATKATKVNLTAYLGGDPVATRKTARAYTAAVVGIKADGTTFGWSWHGRLDLAAKELENANAISAEDRAAKAAGSTDYYMIRHAETAFFIATDIRQD